MLQQLGNGMKGLVLDLADVKSMTSFGLGMCIELRNSAKACGATTAVVGISNELRELFKMMKVDRLFTMAAPPVAKPSKPLTV